MKTRVDLRTETFGEELGSVTKHNRSARPSKLNLFHTYYKRTQIVLHSVLHFDVQYMEYETV